MSTEVKNATLSIVIDGVWVRVHGNRSDDACRCPAHLERLKRTLRAHSRLDVGHELVLPERARSDHR